MNEPEVIVRTVRFPVLKPLPPATWEDLGQDLEHAWRQTTIVANVLMGRLASADLAGRGSTEGALPAFPKLNLYRLGIATAPDLPSHTISILDRLVRRRWTAKNAQGFRTRWASHVGKASVPNFRFPAPLSVKQGDWKAGINPSGEAWVQVPILRAAKRQLLRYTLILKSGGFRPQYETFKKILSGEYEGRDVRLYQAKAGSQTPFTMLAMSYRMPKPPIRGQGDLLVYTTRDILLRAARRGARDSWWCHRRDLPAIIERRTQRRQELSQDNKSLMRSQRGGVQRKQEVEGTRFGHRQRSAIEQAATSLVQHAVNRSLGRIVYDDAVHWEVEFPWAALRQQIQQQCEERGVEFTTTKELQAERERQEMGLELARLRQHLQQLDKESTNEQSDRPGNR